MDKLDRLIADKQAEIEEAKKQAAALADKRNRLEIQLESLKQAAELRPAITPAVAVDPPANSVQTKKEGNDLAALSVPPKSNGGKPFGGTKGRQRGDISKGWRKTLKRVYLQGQKASYGDFHRFAQTSGLKCGLANVRGRVRSMTAQGFLSGGPEEGYVVTETAIRRFGFNKKETPPGESPEGVT